MIKPMFAVVAACALATSSVREAPAESAMAQQWPQRNVRMIVAFGPGGGADIVGRIIAQSMQEKLGQPVVVENRPGAAGTLGNEAVARADKDGYTLGVMTAGQIIAAVMNKSLRYDTLTAFEPISLVARAGLIIVTRPDFPTNDVKELVAAAKARPGKIAFASPGFGATQHFTGELFKQITRVDMLHVPFRTSPEAIAAVLGTTFLGNAYQSSCCSIPFPRCSGRCRPGSSRRLRSLARTDFQRFQMYRQPSNPASFPATTSRPGMACSLQVARRPS